MCSVSGSKFGEWFEVSTGAKQGCVLSPLILLMAKEWILKRTTAVIPAAIQWIGNCKLCDLNFTDDKALLTDSKEDNRNITSKLSNQAAVLGLQFNMKKTKLIEVGKMISLEDISINGEDIMIVKDFRYSRSFISDNSY